MKKTLSYLFIFFLFTSCLEPKDPKNILTVFHAGSLSVPFHDLSTAFKKENPKVEIHLEASGSREAARKISELKRVADVMASADYSVIENLLYPGFADWNIKFATNEMVLAYVTNTRYKDIINSDNWFDILRKPDVKFGRSDPDADPCGYRSILTLKLAANYYKRPFINDELIKKDTQYIRVKETDLLAVLETNVVDYIFIYKSVAIQHALDFILLPKEINLSDMDLTNQYKKVSVQVSGKKPGEFITHYGEPMVYGLTIPKSATNPELALRFVEFILSEKGKKIIIRNGQKIFKYKNKISDENIPARLTKILEQG